MNDTATLRVDGYAPAGRPEVPQRYPSSYICQHVPHSRTVAVGWVVALAASQGSTPMLDVPDLSCLNRDESLRAFAGRFPVMTWQRRDLGPWQGGPILSAYPDRRRMGELADFGGASGLCVLAWRTGEVLGWATSVGATELEPSAVDLRATLPPLDPVVRQALLSLGRRVNRGLTPATKQERQDTVTWFGTLKRAGLPLQPHVLYAHALVDGWSARGAHRLRQLADQVEAGQSLEGWDARCWASSSVDVWRDAALAQNGALAR